MSQFVSLIRSRLENGVQLPPLGELGWVRAALAQAHPSGEAAPGCEDEGASIWLEGCMGEEVSKSFWEGGVWDRELPDGFYFLTPNEDVRLRFAAFPSLASLEATPRSVAGDVLLVDRRRDAPLRSLARLAHRVLLAAGEGSTQEAELQRVAEIVADFYGGATSEALTLRSRSSASAVDATACSPKSDSAPSVVLVTDLERGTCRPRALLFKHLCDVLGFPTRLIMGFQMEAVPLSPLAGVKPHEHLSVVARLESGLEVLVDLLKKPGLLRLVSPKALLAYHVGHAGDSDGAEYESGDSGPNSPLFGTTLGPDTPDHEVLDSPRLRLQRQRLSSQAAHAPAAAAPPLDASLPTGDVQPSRNGPGDSEDAEVARSPGRFQGSPNSANGDPGPRQQGAERHVMSSPEQRSLPRRHTRNSLFETGSLPTSPDVSLDLRRRVHSEEGSLPSSPELSQRVYPASTLGSARRFLLDEGDQATSSPEAMPAHHPPFARRRSRKKSIDIDDTASHNLFTSALLRSPDRPPRVLTRVSTPGGLGEGARSTGRQPGGTSPAHARQDDRPGSGGSSGHSSGSLFARHLVRQRSSDSSVPPRPHRTPSPSSADRRATRKSVPEVTDDVVRAVRAMKESLRGSRRRSESVVRGGEAGSVGGASDRSMGTPRHSQPIGQPYLGPRQPPTETERCLWCRRASVPGWPAAAVAESYLHRLDRLGLDYPPPRTRPPAVPPSPASLRAFLRLASPEQVVPTFAKPRPAMPPPPALPADPGTPLVSSSMGHEGPDPIPTQGPPVGEPLRSPSELAALMAERLVLPFPEWHIEFAEIKLGIRVGVGSFGEVFRGIWRGTEVAVKLLLEQDLSPDPLDDFCTEVALLSRLRHPNVILFLGACTRVPHLSMVTEYMHMGSLYRLLHASGQGARLSLRRRLKMLRDICRGMMCIQRMNIVHRDLKSANCLVDKHWAVKVSDFGLSRLAPDAAQPGATAVGTPEWMAPELLRSQPATFKADVFSFGVIVWEMSTLRRPWEGLKPQQVVHAVVHQQARLPPPPGVLGKLIADCFAEDPASRPSWEECLARLHESEFLQDLDD